MATYCGVDEFHKTASTAHTTPNPIPTASTSESRYIPTSTSTSDGNSPPAPVAMIVGVTVGVLAAILLAAGALFVVCVRKRKRTHYSRTLTTVLPESPGARPEQKPLMIDNPDVTELAADSSTMSSRIQLLHMPPQPTDDRLGHDFNSDGKTFSIESESTDTMSSLPPRPAIKRKAVSMLALGTAREGRAVSVMTDTSETLTMGGAGEVDDIHVIT
ncbi:hypothetical protein QBC37DRAFT_386202 [Rhypophila decipiens]|uniref:Uncharacterized protein n=1 Tax=Rhypophila decipiens TaxID=261697 RepID=A0AAN6YCP7_9PEZI|nr:hypothetical protein QBC37DRAFT_386202 [Rhypophila decipiens]